MGITTNDSQQSGNQPTLILFLEVDPFIPQPFNSIRDNLKEKTFVQRMRQTLTDGAYIDSTLNNGESCFNKSLCLLSHKHSCCDFRCILQIRQFITARL